MKLIVLDFLRRWGWLYLLGFVLATTFNMLAKYVGPFVVFTPYFLAPMLGPLFVVAADFMRGAAGVTIALPVSIRKVGLSYWIVGVCMPPVLLSLALIVANLITQSFNPMAIPWGEVASTFVISFLIAGSIFFDLTLFKIGPQSDLLDKIVGTVAGALWGVSAFSSMAVKFIIDFRKGDVLTMTILIVIGLFMTTFGFLRAEEVVRVRARNRLAGQDRKSTPSMAKVACAEFGLSGLPYMAFESLKFALGMSAALMIVPVLLQVSLEARSFSVSWMFVNYSLVICALLPGLRYFTALRHIRALPISIDRVAFIIVALPVLNFLICLGVIVVTEAILAPGTFKFEAPLLLTIGIASFANSLAVRFGSKSLPWIMGLAIIVLFPVTEFLRNLPVAGSWIIGAVLIIAAYPMARLSLRSSEPYRVPAANLSMG